VASARPPPPEESATRAESMETSSESTYTPTTGRATRRRPSPLDSPSTPTRTHLPDSELLEKRPRPGREEEELSELVTTCLERPISSSSRCVTTIPGGSSPLKPSKFARAKTSPPSPWFGPLTC